MSDRRYPLHDFNEVSCYHKSLRVNLYKSQNVMMRDREREDYISSPTTFNHKVLCSCCLVVPGSNVLGFFLSISQDHEGGEIHTGEYLRSIVYMRDRGVKDPNKPGGVRG
jgi:hypothetical protein